MGLALSGAAFCPEAVTCACHGGGQPFVDLSRHMHMTTTPALPSLVLRGSSATARFGDGFDYVQWEEDGRVTRIPLDAIEAVRSLDRSFQVVLTTAEADRRPAVYAVHDASTAAVTTFCAALQARLPERGDEGLRVDGEDLITEVPAGHPRTPSKRVLLVAVIAVFAVIDGAVAVLREPAWAIALPFLQLFASTGVFLALTLGRGLYEALRLPKHGITVMAELDHYTDSTKVYRYEDQDGGLHFYRDRTGGQQLELSYDPNNPSRASTRQSLYGQVMMALMSVVGLGMACGGLGITGYQLFIALRG
ncbi:DUF3592 domain-containing protein [Streptomyces sp. NPDC005791]|uniref:DUF3592 domain-containing protein n=1 Tax=Streptomyces sp. NPDC005791 TaxID=3364732 RepID=UPI0036BD1CE9